MSVHYAPQEPDGRWGPTLCRSRGTAPGVPTRTITKRPALVTCGRCLRSLALRPWVESMLRAEDVETGRLLGESAPGPAGPGASEDTMRARDRGTDPERGESTP